jgi:GAF domain-containing protein
MMRRSVARNRRWTDVSTSGSGSAGGEGQDIVELLDQSEDLTGFLDHLVRRAVDQTPGAEACGLTLELLGRPQTVTYSGELALRGDERQYELDDGPCLHSLRSGDVVRVTDMAAECRWGDYPKLALEAGVQSTLSFPLTVGDQGRGALNLYASQADAFADTDERVGRSWAGQASGALSVAWRLAARDEAVDNLTRGLATRQVIGQAVGMLMAQRRCTADEGFAVLREASQRGNEKLRDVAQRMVADHETRVRSSR